MALKTANRDGINLCYLDEGAGDPPLLFVHRWCCAHSHWRDQTSEFGLTNRVVAVDLRGHGASDKPDQNYTIGGFVDDVAWLIGKTGLQRPVVIGHSMGGVITCQPRAQAPKSIRAAVIVDSPLTPMGPQFEPIRQQISAGLRSPQYQQAASQFISNFLFREDSPAALREEVIAGMTSASQRVMHSAIESTFDEQYLQPGSLPVPALFARAATLPVTEEQLPGSHSRHGSADVGLRALRADGAATRVQPASARVPGESAINGPLVPRYRGMSGR